MWDTLLLDICVHRCMPKFFASPTHPADAEKDIPRTFHCLRSSLRLSGSVRVVPQCSTSISCAVAMPEGNRRSSTRICL